MYYHWRVFPVKVGDPLPESAFILPGGSNEHREAAERWFREMCTGTSVYAQNPEQFIREYRRNPGEKANRNYYAVSCYKYGVNNYGLEIP